MYLLYESLYGDLQQENDTTEIIGLYDTLEKAQIKAKELIEKDTKENEYILDVERNNLEEDNFVRLFWNWQENWDCYYEIVIKEMVVE